MTRSIPLYGGPMYDPPPPHVVAVTVSENELARVEWSDGHVQAWPPDEPLPGVGDELIGWRLPSGGDE